MATSRKYQSSNVLVITSIGASGCDYSTLSAWEDATDYNLTAAGTCTYKGQTDWVAGSAGGATWYFYQENGAYIGAGILTHPMNAAKGSHRFSVNSFDTSYGTANLHLAVLALYSGDTTKSIIVEPASYTNNIIEVGELKAETFTLAATLTIAGASPDANNYRVLRAQTAPKGVVANYPLIYAPISGHAVSFQEGYSRAYDIAFQVAANSSTSYAGCTAYAVSLNVFVGCVAIDCSNSGTGNAHGFWTYFGDSLMINCLAHNMKDYYVGPALIKGGDGFRVELSGGRTYNCTADTCNCGVRGVSANLYIKNCLATNCTTSFTGSTTSSNTATSATYKSGTDNFHLAYNDTNARNKGASLATDISYQFTDDVDFENRPYGASWDIGWDEYSSSSSISSSSSSSSISSSSSSSISSSSSSSSYFLHDFHGGMAFGEENPNQGEKPKTWQTWDDGLGNVIEVMEDLDWGKIKLDLNDEGRSAVYQYPTARYRFIDIESGRYGVYDSPYTTLQVRGSATSFTQDAASPSWETYTERICRNWKYIQVRILH